MFKVYRGLTIAFGVWLIVWLWLSWPAMQDDAFIHLRYAANLLQHHMISYDGVHPDYGTSSLLYVWLLAALRSFCTSPVLPRMLSSIFHLLLFGGLVWGFAVALRAAPKIAWGFALLLIGLLVAPVAVRWLDDGMETSLTLCLISLIAFSVSRLGHSDEISNSDLAWLFILGLVATLTRVEYLLLLAVASLTLFAARLSLPDRRAGQRHLSARLVLALHCGAPLCGSVLGAAIIFYTMHSLLPDTAVAKADGSGAWLGTLLAILSVFVSSMSIGVILLSLWVLTSAAVTAYSRRLSPPILLANSLFPITVLLAVMRGQKVQGIRYFLWTLLFPILWNILELRWTNSVSRRSLTRILQFATYGLAGAFALLIPIESRLLFKEFRARTASLALLQTQHLERLKPLTLVAYDIGYIGYFTGSPVCDMAGLVNGKDRARLSTEQRVRICAAAHPEYAFLTRPGMGNLNNSLDLSAWSVCSVYDFANLRASDLHYLIASPAATAEVCAAAGSSPQPLEKLLHPSSAR
jgi:hypothetical protein